MSWSVFQDGGKLLQVRDHKSSKRCLEVITATRPTRIYSTNPLERLNRKVKRRTDGVGISPDIAAVIRLAGAVLIKINDGWQAGQRCRPCPIPFDELCEFAAPIH